MEKRLKKCELKFEGSLEDREIASFKKLGTLGMGSYAKVFKVKSLKTGKVYAMKEIAKAKLNKELFKYIENEVEIMEKMNHRHIIRMFYHLEDSVNVYLIIELA